MLDRARRRRVVAVIGIVLCLAVFWPGVVDEANRDARPVNAIAGAGVLVALAQSLLCRFDGWSRGVRGDGYRDAVRMLAVLVSLPWLFAEVGLCLDRVPLLGRAFDSWKRGSTDWQFPGLLQPSLSVGWSLIVLGAALIIAMSIESPHSRMGRLAQQRR